jgi:hypothetical protein
MRGMTWGRKQGGRQAIERKIEKGNKSKKKVIGTQEYYAKKQRKKDR